MSLLFEFDDTNEPEHIELFNAFCNKNKRTIKQINSLERKLNIMLSNLNDYLNQDNISLDYFNETRTEILQRINELDHVYETYIDMLSDLTMITDENLHHLETKHITYVNNIKTKLSRMKTQIVPDTILNTNESLSSTHSEGHFAKLPAIHIPNFDGTDRVQFQDFFALFISIIDKRSDINDMSKLMYLKSYLKGNALKVISSLALTDSNYTKAKQLLTMEYDDPNLKIATLIDQLINFSTHDSILAPDLLEKLVRTRSYIYELQNTGVDILNGHASATIIARIIFSRCPDYFRRALYQKLLTYYPTLQEILDNFSEILRQQVEYEPERYTKYERSNLPRTITKTQFVRPERNTNTSTVSSLSEFNKRPTSEIKCSFCSSTQHVATACHTYPTFQSRLRKLQTSNRCVRCTREGHSASQCTRIIKYPCSICKSFKHFTPMCDDNEDTRRTQQHMISPEAVTFNESIIENESKGNHSTKTTNDSADTKRSKSTKFLTEFNRKYRNNTLLSAQTNSNGHNLLPLVLVEIKNDKNTRYGVLLVDSGSEKTFIDSELAGKEKLQGSRYRINTVAGTKTMFATEQTITCRLGRCSNPVQLNAQVTRNFEIPINNVKLRQVIRKMDENGIRPALPAELDFDWNKMLICGIIGADNLHVLGDWQLRQMGSIQIYQTNVGNIPCGHIPENETLPKRKHVSFDFTKNKVQRFKRNE